MIELEENYQDHQGMSVDCTDSTVQNCSEFTISGLPATNFELSPNTNSENQQWLSSDHFNLTPSSSYSFNTPDQINTEDINSMTQLIKKMEYNIDNVSTPKNRILQQQQESAQILKKSIKKEKKIDRTCSKNRQYYQNKKTRNTKKCQLDLSPQNTANMEINNNNAILFINITKSRNFENQSEKQYSKYHNFAKLYFNSLLQVFNMQNLKKIPNITNKEIDQVLRTINLIKQSGKKENKQKYQIFSNSHYQLLFLKLNATNVHTLTPQSQQLHEQIFGIDITQITNNNNKLLQINEIKQKFYDIFQCIGLQDIEVLPSFKIQYWQTLEWAAQQMNESVVVKRFTI